MDSRRLQFLYRDHLSLSIVLPDDTLTWDFGDQWESLDIDINSVVQGPASQLRNLPLELPAVAEFDTQGIEVGLHDIKYRIPAVKSLFNENVEIQWEA